MKRVPIRKGSRSLRKLVPLGFSVGNGFRQGVRLFGADARG